MTIVTTGVEFHAEKKLAGNEERISKLRSKSEKVEIAFGSRVFLSSEHSEEINVALVNSIGEAQEGRTFA